MKRLALVRPLTGQIIHPEIPWITGDDAPRLSGPGDVAFTVAPDWHDRLADDGHPFFMHRGTLAVVHNPNGTIQQVGLVDDLDPRADALGVSCGGFSMLPGQSGPWEGHQGWYTSTDPVELLRIIWEQVQSYPDANLGVRLTGDTSSGSMVGSVGSARWRKAYRTHLELKPAVDRLEARVLDHERVLARREEEMFRAAGLKRVGSVTVAEARPDDPGYKADSTLWVRESDRLAHRWYNGRWNANRNANEAVAWWFTSTSNLEKIKAQRDEAKYEFEPAEEALERYESEAREEYSLYFWQNHDLNSVIDDLMARGPFEFREEAAWDGDRLDLQIRVGAPTVGVKRHELHLELGVNVQDVPAEEYGEQYTGVTLFGAGEGSEVLSEQRDLGLDQVVRRILVETDKDAITKTMTRTAANKLVKEARKQLGASITDLVVHHTAAVPVGAFQVGDQIPLTGKTPSGEKMTRWLRVLSARHVWGSTKTELEVEPV